jgi:hypothetical protein
VSKQVKGHLHLVIEQGLVEGLAFVGHADHVVFAQQHLADRGVQQRTLVSVDADGDGGASCTSATLPGQFITRLAVLPPTTVECFILHSSAARSATMSDSGKVLAEHRLDGLALTLDANIQCVSVSLTCMVATYISIA